MTLSFTLRLLCLLTVLSGFIYAAAQLLLSLNARFILSRLEAATARRRECILYLVQIAPLLLAIMIANAFCLPEYLRYEPTRETESVGWLCLLLAAAVVLWFVSTLVSGLRMALRTLDYVRACQTSGHVIRHTSQSTPVLALAEANPPFALVGFMRPLILVSADLLEAGGLDADALRVALDHERSHAEHHDNWKLLSLSFLPRLPVDPWLWHWQRAADWAADDDAVRGDSARSLLLAQALVYTARAVRNSRPSVICATLTSAETGLAVRVGRLLHPPQPSRPAPASLHLGLVALLLLLAGAAVISFPWTIYSLFERILHLGGV
ncbi:MAG TPA: hypothetical protein VGG72_21695 [Bryobacteraceae bacterium]|jgi:beta-lactamase regulating signal transducer with metallopeptidase domain